MSLTDTSPDPASPVPDEPEGLGRNYARLWTASVISNLGDGIDSTALPLLAAALTRDPLLVSGVAVAARLPWLVFALQAGAIADRVDRRRLMWRVNAVRFVLMGILGFAVLGACSGSDCDPGTRTPMIVLLYAISFGLGIAETLFDNAAQAILPSMVARPRLEQANGRLFAGEIVTNQFVGPPLGGLIFPIAASLPFMLDAGTFALSAILIFTITGGYVAKRPGANAADAAAGEAAAPAVSMRTQIREGLAWLWDHRLLRMLAILLGFMNGTFMMGTAILVLYATGPDSILGLPEIGFGLLLTAAAIGSLLGSMTAGRVVARFGRGPALWFTLIGAVIVPLVIGLTSSAVVVGVASVLLGYAAVVWNVITVSLRQTIIPDELLGRVNSVYRFLGWGAMPIGSLLGGVLADGFGLRAPFIVAAGLMALVLVPAIPVITSANIEAARREAGAPE